MSALTLETRAVTYEFEVEIDAPRDAVWSSLTEEVDGWWLPDFHMVGEGSVVAFDARAGGQLVETKEGGGSLLWYTVHMCTPGESVYLVGHVAPDWGGPATSMLKIALSERVGGTRVAIQDSLFGHVSDSNVESLRSGWMQLFGEGLKRYAENR